MDLSQGSLQGSQGWQLPEAWYNVNTTMEGATTIAS